MKFTIILVLGLLTFCANPIEKKKRELKNLKITLSKVTIKKYNLMFIPPVPKIYFDVFLNIENENPEEATIEKMNFKIYNNPEKDNILIASAKTTEEYKLKPKEIKEIKISMVTNFEENKEEKVLNFVGRLLKALINNDELEFFLDGYVEYNTFLGKINIPFSQMFKTRVRI